MTLISSGLISDSSGDHYRLTTPVINGSSIDVLCKDVLKCAVSARSTNTCEDCNQIAVNRFYVTTSFIHKSYKVTEHLILADIQD